MMLDYLGEEKAASILMDAIIDTVQRLKSLEAGRMGYSTTEVGDMVVRYIEENG